MGSGKSTVGRRLAEKLKVDFKDLDDLIVSAENREIPEIFTSSGEIYFRRREAEILQQALERETDFVLSVGGGTPCYGKNLQILKQTPNVKTVYLKTSLQELTKRLQAERESRPLIKHLKSLEELEDFIRKHLFERSFYYNQCELIVNTDNKDVSEIVEEILVKLE